MIRKNVSGLPSPDLTPTATVLNKPLSECRVAICTTAGLRSAGDIKLWMDASFTVLPNAARDLQLSHFSPNFDRAGLTADLNTAYPADRLNELVDAGVIGSVATKICRSWALRWTPRSRQSSRTQAQPQHKY